MNSLVVIMLVCSQLAVPDTANCVIDTSLRHERLELPAKNDAMCGLNGMIAAAERMHLDMKSEYLKVMCVRPSVDSSRVPG
jgi:hypothetical protein